MGPKQSSSPEVVVEQQKIKKGLGAVVVVGARKQNKHDNNQVQDNRIKQDSTNEASSSSSELRPKRRATNAHIFRYLQTRNPTKLEENDLKKALEASLEECPDFWPEDTASCSSSEQSNASSGSSSSSSTSGNSIEGNSNNNNNNRCVSHQSNNNKRSASSSSTNRRRSKKSMQQNHLNCSNPYNHSPHNHNHSSSSNYYHPLSSVHNRYKPVAKKNIYDEADFFHEGIMEYIEYELSHKKNKH